MRADPWTRRERILQMAQKVSRASHPSDFMACCYRIGRLPEADRAGPWTLVGLRLAQRRRLQHDDAWLILGMVLDGLERLPVGPRSAEKLAAPALAVFDALLALQGGGGRADRTCAASPAAMYEGQARLDRLIRRHGLQSIPGVMAQLMARVLRAGVTPGWRQWLASLGAVDLAGQ